MRRPVQINRDNCRPLWSYLTDAAKLSTPQTSWDQTKMVALVGEARKIIAAALTAFERDAVALWGDAWTMERNEAEAVAYLKGLA